MKEAITVLKRALELEPESRLIHQELAKIREKARIEAESEKSLYRRMLGLKKEVTHSNERYPTIKSVSTKPAAYTGGTVYCPGKNYNTAPIY